MSCNFTPTAGPLSAPGIVGGVIRQVSLTHGDMAMAIYDALKVRSRKAG